jgi:hypothetical protein
MAKNQNVQEPEGFDSLAGVTDDNFDGPFFVEQPQPRVFESPDMDPGSKYWNPRKYFAAQPKVTVVVDRTDSDILSDPRNENKVTVPVSINGYTLNIIKGKPVNVPLDFALHIVDIGAGHRYGDIEDAVEA